jgi:hypothetical protein
VKLPRSLHLSVETAAGEKCVLWENPIVDKSTRTLKGRIGEAFVESIFRRAGYKVSRLGRESQVQQMLRTGSSEFLPDFLVWKAVEANDAAPLARMFNVEVKYRRDIPSFLQRFAGEFLADVVEQWRDLYVVLVTDDPEPGRSCFQVLQLRDRDASLAPVNLWEVEELGVYRSTAEEYEDLVKQVFSLLGAQSRGRESVRKPPRKVDPANTPRSEPRASAS